MSAAVWRLVASALSLVVFALIARQAGAADLAVYAVASAALWLLQPLPLLGLQLAVVRDGAAVHASTGALARAALAVAIPVAILLAAIVASPVASRLALPLREPSRWVALGVLAGGPICVAEAVLASQQRLGRVAKVAVAETLWRGVATLISLRLGAPPTVWVALLAIGRVGTAVVHGAMVIAPALRSHGGDWHSRTRTLLRSSPAYIGIAVASALLGKVDTLVLAAHVDANVVGRYAVAVKVFDLLLLFSSVAVTVAYAPLARIRSRDRSTFVALLASIVDGCGLVALPVALLVLVGSGTLVQAAFGDDYLPSARLAGWFIEAAFITVYNQLYASFLLIEHRAKEDLSALVAACCTTLGALAALVPAYGADGAAWAVVIGAVTQLAVRVQRCAADPELVAAGRRAMAAAAVATGAVVVVCFAGVWGRPAVALAAALLALGTVRTLRPQWTKWSARMAALGRAAA